MNIYSNPLVMKIKDGTVRSDVNLCKTCKNHFYNRQAQTGKEVHICKALDSGTGGLLRIIGPVAECNHYRDASTPSLGAMEDIAWKVNVNKATVVKGFAGEREERIEVKITDPEDEPNELPIF